MAFGLTDLVAALALEPTEGGVTGPNLDLGYYRIFGGQILAQALVAAADASPEKTVKSLHVLFPREGNAEQPLHYRVDKLSDGRTFGATQVTATQEGKVIAAATVSLHADEDGLRRSDDPPAVGAPEEAPVLDVPMVPWEVRSVGGVDVADRTVGPPDLQLWMRTPPLAVDRLAVHQALLSHATDLTLIGTALRPFEGISQADSTVTLQTAVTSHSMWFHQPFRMDDWVLLSQHSPVVAKGRSWGRGEVFGAAGDVVASFAQEAMVRQIEPAA
ncbi:MAG TPA: acyl-CoA thioesterase domain-containing protein [Acidimicrobiales bacterium]|nr:acyl-CoA thioesterase domain-containing protein [Acidimicrobiales bacterium]